MKSKWTTTAMTTHDEVVFGKCWRPLTFVRATYRASFNTISYNCLYAAYPGMQPA
jgi:hypothetical protein